MLARPLSLSLYPSPFLYALDEVIFNALSHNTFSSVNVSDRELLECLIELVVFFAASFFSLAVLLFTV